MLEFMKNVVQIAIAHFWGFNGVGMHLALFFATLLYLFAVKKKGEEKTRNLILGYSFAFAMVYVFPMSAYIIMEYCIGEAVYWRMFWMLPFIIVIGYVLVLWLFQTEGKKQFLLFLCMAVVMIVITGKPVYTQENFYPAENEYKLPQEAIDLCDFIKENRKEGETVKVTVPNELLCYIRQYDASIQMPYGRNALTGQKLGKRRTQIYEMMTSGSIEWEKMISLLKKEHSNYFVYPAEIGIEELEREGYAFLGNVDGYSVYYCENME
ncbi:MAG: hypothetical protein HFI37_01025 [Lachnospiraceae bacterium]|jgi:hypothetical protein|nr:hypothetical protein [Lachnospiraceae bacterium]